jgi:hypothetical protein
MNAELETVYGIPAEPGDAMTWRSAKAAIATVPALS